MKRIMLNPAKKRERAVTMLGEFVPDKVVAVPRDREREADRLVATGEFVFVDPDGKAIATAKDAAVASAVEDATKAAGGPAPAEPPGTEKKSKRKAKK